MPGEVMLRHVDRQPSTEPWAGQPAGLVREAPPIWVEDGFASAHEQEAVLELGDAAERAAGPGTKRDATGFSVELSLDAHPVLGAVGARILDRVGGSHQLHQPSFRFRRYRPGDGHPAHSDHFEVEGAWLLVTAMVVLQAPVAGGATRFDLAVPAVRVPAVAGRLVLWCNHLKDGAPDRLAVHEGEPVTEGEKATVTRFLYGPPALAAEIHARLT